MLMVGEAVLQLVLADSPPEYSKVSWHATIVGGYVLAVALLYSFNITEPHHAEPEPASRTPPRGQRPAGNLPEARGCTGSPIPLCART